MRSYYILIHTKHRQNVINCCRVICCSSMIIISGRVDVSRISGGMVAGGLSTALRVGRSAKSLTWGCSPFFMPLVNAFRALSCLHVYLPCNRAVGQFERLWWTVGKQFSQRWHFESTLIFHLFKLSGVGRVSEPAFRRKANWPAGKPAWFRFQTFFAFSSVISRNLFWTVSWLNLSSLHSQILVCFPCTGCSLPFYWWKKLRLWLSQAV